MTSDIIEINDFVVLIDTTDAQEAETIQCQFDDEIIGISFYGSGNVEIDVSFKNSKQTLKSQKGMAFSFFGNDTVSFSHRILQSEPLKSVSIFSTAKNIQKLPPLEKELFANHLGNLLSTNKDFESGPSILMTPEMHTAISKIFQTQFQNTSRLLFLKSQVIELLSHYFAKLGSQNQSEFNSKEIEKIQQAREIIVQNIETPPSLTELSKLVGLNNNKLNKNFKQLFGVPVFKYLQNQRLQKAYHLLSGNEMTVQEVAWSVGYESLSSFSNAFHDKFGLRPSAVTK